MVKQKNKHKCNCIVAFHIGHSQIEKSEATKKMITGTCCGGVFLLDYCPICGKKIEDKTKYVGWQTIARRKDVRARIKGLKEEKELSNFMKSVLENYQEELKEPSDALEKKGDGGLE